MTQGCRIFEKSVKPTQNLLILSLILIVGGCHHYFGMIFNDVIIRILEGSFLFNNKISALFYENA